MSKTWTMEEHWKSRLFNENLLPKTDVDVLWFDSRVIFSDTRARYMFLSGVLFVAKKFNVDPLDLARESLSVFEKKK